jgi:hypothetical protein
MIDLSWVTLLLGVVLPLLTGLATARFAHPGVKAGVLAALSAAGGLVSELYDVGGELGAVDWSAAGADAVAVFLIGVGLHFGLLKPAGVTGADGVVQTGPLSGGLGARPGAHRRPDQP